MIIGINCTANEVILAETSGSKDDFEIKKIDRYEFSLNSAEECADLYSNLKTLLAAVEKDDSCRAVFSSCSSGTRGSSIAAIKAEAIAELACHNLRVDVSHTKPQSLKKALGCSANETWQSKAKELFNGNGKFKYFGNGSNAAVAVAYKEAE